MSKAAWLPGSLFDNIDKFASSLGYQNSAIIMELAMVEWKSPDERDSFIMALTGQDVQGGTEKNYITSFRR